MIAASLLTACATNAPSSGQPTAVASASPTTAATPTPEPKPTRFTSNRYGYALTLPAGWTGGQALRTWDGQGAPGYDSLPVDKFGGQTPITAWAYAAPFDGTLAEWVTATLQAAAAEHACPDQAETNELLAMGAERGRLLSVHCPADGGLFVVMALAVHSGTGYVFAAQDSSGASAEETVRSEFHQLFNKFQFSAT